MIALLLAALAAAPEAPVKPAPSPAALVAAITSGKQDEADQAAYALEPEAAHLSPADSARLAALLEGPPEREGFLRQVGRLVGRSPAGAARLTELAASGKSPSARVYAASGLADEGSAASEAERRAATEQLLAALTNPDDSARLAHNLLPRLEPWTARWLLDHLAAEGPSSHLAFYGLELLAGRPKEELRAERHAAFARGLSHPEEIARMNAVSGLVALGLDKADLPLYQQAARDPSPQVHRMLLARLVSEPPPPAWAAPLLEAALADPLEENRATAAQGLGELDDRHAAPALAALLQQGVASGQPLRGDHRAAGAALAHLGRLKGIDFSAPVECVEMGPGAHAMVVREKPETYLASAKKVLAWWESKGKEELGGR